jgi:hypothetical protein
MMEDTSLDPRLEAQLYKVLSAFQKAWKIEAVSLPALQKAVGSDDGRSTAPDEDRKAVEAFYRANPDATTHEAMIETGISIWRCRRIREGMDLPRQRRKRDSMLQKILAAMARNPHASPDDIAEATGARRKYAAEVMRLKRFGLI